MKLTKGLSLDVKEIDVSEGSWVYAKNIIISDKFGSIINEEGFKEFSSTYSAKNLKPIGAIEALDEVVIFSVPSEIGILKKSGVYTTMLADNNLGFDIAYPIKGTFKYNRNRNLIVSFIADNISPMLINLNKLPDNIAKARIFPDIKAPKFSLEAVLESEGTVKSGAYYFSIAYRNNEYSQTNWLGTSNPVSVIDDNIFSSFNTVDGCEADTPTGKAISLKITNIDLSYDKLVVAVISRINGTLRISRLPEISITSSTIDYLYSGNETTTDLALEEITIERPFYTNAKAITQMFDRLLLGNPKSIDSIDFQSYANAITTSYTTLNINPSGLGGYKNPTVIFDSKTFMDGDVYAFYIALKFNDGSRSRAFHIPGRVARGTELSDHSVAAGNLNATNFSENAKEFHIQDTADSPGVGAKLGYWENLSERYPNNATWGNLANTPVRHHKMPTIEKLGYSPSEVKAIGIKFDNIVIPSELQSIVQGYEIFYAKKTINNSQVLGQDIVLFAGTFITEESTSNYWTTGGNWSIRPRKPTGSTWDFFRILIQNKYLRLHSFDILRLRPQISPTHIVIHKLIKKNGTNLEFSTFGKEGAVIERSKSGKEQNTSMIFDYTSSNTEYTNPTSANKIREIVSGSFRYIPAHTNDGDFNNWFGEDCANMELEKPGYLGMDDVAIKAVSTEYDTGGADPILRIHQVGPTEEVTALISICQLKKDVYNSFLTQQLVSTGAVGDKDQTSITCFGGDTFINNYSFITTAARHSDENPEEVENHKLGVKIIRNIVVKSYSNIGYRHQDARDETKYYPKVPSLKLKEWLQDYDRTISFKILYNTDYNSSNDITGVFPETFEQRPDNYPHRIIQSIELGRESELDSWNRFLPNDYYEVIKDKGEIINLVAMSNTLFIHLERDLLRTVGQENLQVQGIDVYLGSGKIFDREPVSTIPATRGYAGTTSRYANLLCKLGYIFIDSINGKIFVVSNETEEISNKGIKQFLRESLVLEINNQISEFLGERVYIDNPFISAGNTLLYEENYNRLIISKKDFLIIDMNRFKGKYDSEASYASDDIYLKGHTLLKGAGVRLEDSDVYDKSLSISYSFDFGVWICFHDYIMEGSSHVIDKNLIFKNNKIYETNRKERRAIYFTEEPFSSIIIPIFNANADTNKLFTRFTWLTDIVNPEKGKEVNKTITKITVFNSDQCSGDIEVVPFTDLSTPYTTRKVHDGWNFNEFRDLVVNNRFPFLDSEYKVIASNIDPNKLWFNKGRFTGSWVGLKIEFSNVKNLNGSQNVLYLYSVSAELLQATR